MASQSTEEQLKYILTVLKHTELPQPNYHAVAEETGTASANNAQKKFKAIIESAGFALSNKQIIDPNAEAKPNDESTPKTPVKPRAKKSSPATPKAPKTPKTPKAKAGLKAPGSATSNKKRKIEETIDDSEAGENDGVDDAGNEKQENGSDDDENRDDEV